METLVHLKQSQHPNYYTDARMSLTASFTKDTGYVSTRASIREKGIKI